MRVILVWVFAVLLAFTGPAAATDKATTTFVQEALVELGFDPGPVDGAWGGKTRTALNAYRETKGLEPLQNISGSSLYLLHRDVPGEMTLPNPGILVEGMADRHTFLKENLDIRGRFCNNNLRLPTLDPRWEPVKSFSEGRVVSGSGGYIDEGEDWFSPLSEGMVTASANCLVGNTRYCDVIWDFVQKWVAEDALQTPVRPRDGAEKFDGTAWIGNSVLQPLIFSAAISNTVKPVPFEELAPVLDWFYDRTNLYNFIVTTNQTIGSISNKVARNHAVAAVLPSTTLGAWIGDRGLYQRGLTQFQIVLDNIRDDGSFPTETRRGSRALHYTGLQLSYLTTIAEIARAQGDDLYALKGGSGRDLHDAVDFAFDGWNDWDGVVLKYAKDNLAAPKTPESPMATAPEINLGWLPVYMTRFPDHPNSARAKVLEIDPVVCSPEHIADGRSPEWWCRAAGEERPLTLPRWLLDDSNRISIASHHMGYNAACMVAETAKLFD